MTLLGWVFMACSWFFILALSSFCFYKIFSKKKLD